MLQHRDSVNAYVAQREKRTTEVKAEVENASHPMGCEHVSGTPSRTRMIRFAAYEDFNHDIVRALRRSLPAFDIATVQDAEGSGWPDSRVLEWLAGNGRVL